MSSDNHEKCTDLEIQAQFEREKRKAIKLLKRRVKSARKHLNKAAEDHKRCQRWKEFEHTGKLLQSNMYRWKNGMSEMIVQDWENDGKNRVISLDSKLDLPGQLEKLFHMSRKGRRGLIYAEKALEQAQSQEKHWNQLLREVEVMDDPVSLAQVLELLPKVVTSKERVKKTLPAKPYREFTSASGLKIWVGKKARDNDILTFRLAKGSDWWLHVKDYSGSHVVIRTVKGQEPDHETVLDAAQLALYYSQAEGDADVSITQKKNVTRIKKGKPGQAALTKHKTMYVRKDDSRLKKMRYSSSLNL